jgi:hypothetical protein
MVNKSKKRRLMRRFKLQSVLIGSLGGTAFELWIGKRYYLIQWLSSIKRNYFYPSSDISDKH